MFTIYTIAIFDIEDACFRRYLIAFLLFYYLCYFVAVASLNNFEMSLSLVIVIVSVYICVCSVS